LKTIKIDEKWIWKSWRIYIKYSTKNDCNIIELNNDLFEIVYIYVLAKLINQRKKLKKSFIIIYLIYIIEENKKEIKEKKRDKKKIYIVEGI